MASYSYCDTRNGLIGNGLFAQVARRESLFEAYKRIQRTCEHAQRDPRGVCHMCGLRMPKEVLEPESQPAVALAD